MLHFAIWLLRVFGECLDLNWSLPTFLSSPFLGFEPVIVQRTIQPWVMHITNQREVCSNQTRIVEVGSKYCDHRPALPILALFLVPTFLYYLQPRLCKTMMYLNSGQCASEVSWPTYCPTSIVTRFGEISLLWRYFKRLWQFNAGLFCFGDNFEPTLAKRLCNSAQFHWLL